MKTNIKKIIGVMILFALFLQNPAQVFAQEKQSAAPYFFTMDYEVDRTPVKDQGKTGTCWCFATLSFLESEILRMGGEALDLSEMYLVRHLYPHKALNYFRLQGNTVFGQGSLSHDALYCLKECGIVPEEVYNGKQRGEEIHNHAEMYAILKAMLDAVLTMRSGEVTPLWTAGFESVLDVYLGKPPEMFTYKGKQYTPKNFADAYLKLDLNTYVELTSFTHHPFYKSMRLEVPDNWSFYNKYINIPLDELEMVVDYALENGYSVAWDGDMSEEDYATSTKRYAIIPADNEGDPEQPVVEKVITQELRQQTFDNFSTTDDHLMHIIGIAHDQNGGKFYVAKDSWFSEKEYGGLIYLSRSYFKLKTIAILVNREIIPDSIQSKISW